MWIWWKFWVEKNSMKGNECIMILSVCGYNCSGSSALIHLLKEYEETKIIDFECMILDLPDGIKDLDYAFHAGGGYFREDRAMKRFQKMIHNHRYVQKASNKKADNVTNQYIDELTAVCWRGRSIYDYVYCDKVEKMFWFLRRLVEKRIYSMTKRRVGFTNRDMRMVDSKRDFYCITKGYMDRMIEAFGGEVDKINVMDQLMPPVDTESYFKYVNNGKAIIVDRDPRDMYLNLHMGVDCNCVPISAHKFVEYHRQWWKDKEVCKNSEDILYIQFEDLIYCYEETISKIEMFLGITEHNHKRDIFRPERSINNTQIFRRVKGYEDDIKYIEQELKDFLYSFPAIEGNGLSEEYKYVKQTGR